MNLSNAVIAGRMTRDIEIRYTNGGTAVGEVSVAVDRKVKKGDEWLKETSFFDVTLWGKMAENASRFTGKGSQVMASGYLSQDRWEKDGQKRSKIKLTAEKFDWVWRDDIQTHRDEPQDQSKFEETPF